MRKSVIAISLAVLGLAGTSPAKACDVLGTPTDVVAMPMSPTSINLTWRNTNNKAGGDQDVWFDIAVTDGAGHPLPQGITGGAEQKGVRYGELRSHLFNGLTPGQEYQFRMRARDEAGTGGCLSKQDSNTAVAWTPTQQIDAKCAPYADRAIQQVNLMKAHPVITTCNPDTSGPRWNPDRSAHYTACAELMRNHQPDFTGADTAGRDDTIKKCVPSAGQCTRYFIAWRNGNDLVPLEWCEEVLGLTSYCKAHGSFVAEDLNTKTGKRALICSPINKKDTPGEQVEHIARGVEQGLQDAFVAASPFLGPASEGLACVNGVIYACAALALDIAEHASGNQVPGVGADVLAITRQAQDCAGGDLGACAQIGLRGAARAGLNIPGKDPAKVAAAAQKCNANDQAACAELGEDAVDAAGLKGAPENATYGSPRTTPQHIVHSVTPPGTPPGPTGPNAFIGVWDTHTGQNAHYRLTLSDSNGVLVGKFENLDNSPQYNGTLTQKPGTTVTGEFFYTYVQPTTKGSGSGEFIVENGGRLIGKIVTNDNPPISTAWFGNRVGAPATSAK